MIIMSYDVAFLRADLILFDCVCKQLATLEDETSLRSEKKIKLH